jgi:RsiW-degrading membrane proteinase PrsW (M82 family)
MEAFILVIGLGFAVLWAFVCRNIAKEKGKDEALAFVLGFFLGLIAVLYYAISSKSEEAKIKEAEKIAEAQERARQKVRGDSDN